MPVFRHRPGVSCKACFSEDRLFRYLLEITADSTGKKLCVIMQQWIEIHSSLYFSIIYYFYCKIFLSGSLDSPEKSACSLHFCGYICGYQNLGCPKREIA